MELTPDITKKYILSKFSEKEIFDKYLGYYSYGELFCSPLRKDNNPTCNIYLKDNNKPIFIDFSGDFKGDVFSFIMKLKNCSFIEAINTIALDFNLSNNFVLSNKVLFTEKHSFQKEIKPTWKKMTVEDVLYWDSYGITVPTLKKFKVCSVLFVWINGVIISTYTSNNPIYCYCLEDNFKFYYPMKKDVRFISNYKGIQGIEHIPHKGELLVITKSYKDVMALYEIGITAIAPQTETITLPNEIITDLQVRFSRVVFLYDFDLTGVRAINKLKKKYEIEYIFLTNGKYGTINYKGKDFSDLIKNTCKTNAALTIKKLLKIK